MNHLSVCCRNQDIQHPFTTIGIVTDRYPQEKLEEIIRRLKSRQMTDCIVVEEKVSKEALKKYGEDTVNAVGATWKQSDVFGYEVNIAKLEQIKAGN